MLEIKNLHVEVEGKQILKGLDLVLRPGQVDAVMGPNGSGKSTLSYVLAGRDGYLVTEGSILYQREDILGLSPDERAAKGIFLAFQYPVSIPGVNNLYFLKTAVNSVRKVRGEAELDAMDFMAMVDQVLPQVDLDKSFLKRNLNEGFSGGEKKRNEILQMLLLQPGLAVLDETDSGLDIDALQAVAKGVNSLRSPERSSLVITHYQRLLDYIVPDRVHVLMKGRIVKTGDANLAKELEAKGYGWLQEGADAG